MVALIAEADRPTQHDYRDGEVYAMAGDTDAHVTVALNLRALLREHLRNRGCRAYALEWTGMGRWSIGIAQRCDRGVQPYRTHAKCSRTPGVSSGSGA